MQLYSTFSRKKEILDLAKNNGHIGLYACGLTVYDYTHLGHLRKYTMDDVLIRTLREAGFKVTFVQNITDVGHLSSDGDTGEDKLEKGAAKYQKTVWEVARQFERYFFYSMDLMGNLRPDISCRATEHIHEQLAMVLELEKKGFTYQIENDGIYFDTSKVAEYGKLAHLDVTQLEEGARIGKVEGKRNSSDFALWKFERPGENRAMVWESPWHPRSFPGWHIECSAMAIHYLGEQFEIHTGGIDHIPVHHTNEIAQAEAATGKVPFVEFWVHHNFLRVDGEKMSKSLGNFMTIDDILAKGISPQGLRLLFLSSHYRSELNFTLESAIGTQRAWQKLLQEVQRLATAAGMRESLQILAAQHAREIDTVSIPEAKINDVIFYNVDLLAAGLDQILDGIQHVTSPVAQQYLSSCIGHLENDLSTAEVVATIWQILKDVSLEPIDVLYVLAQVDRRLGLGIMGAAFDQHYLKMFGKLNEHVAVVHLPEEIQQLLEKRLAARTVMDWAKADMIRQQLLNKGYVVEDTSDGQVVSHNLANQPISE